MLWYAIFIKFDSVVRKENGEIDYVKIHMIDKPTVMPKGIIHWINAKTSIKVEVRLFD